MLPTSSRKSICKVADADILLHRRLHLRPWAEALTVQSPAGMNGAWQMPAWLAMVAMAA
jgi:hypothetical protein